MPANLDRCVEHVKGQGHSEESAWAICNAAINKEDMPEGCSEKLWKEITAPDLPGVNLVPTRPVQKSDPSRPFDFFIPVTKVDRDRREVWGYATLEEEDNASEVMDYASSLPHFLDWSQQAQKRSGGKSRGNLRSMHQAIAAGKLVDLRPDDERKGIYVGGKVVDDDEWKKVLEGVYTGFSVGGKYLRRWADYQKPGLVRYTAQPAEISLVDAPCVPNAVFDVVKGQQTEQRLFKADGAGSNRLLLAKVEPAPAGTAFSFEYEAGGMKFSLTKTGNNELVPPEAIDPQILPWEVAGQPLEQIQPDFKPKDLPENPEDTPAGKELENAGAPAISLESTAAPIVGKVIKVVNSSIKKVKVITK